MGYIRHHTIVVTSFRIEHAKEARAYAAGLFGNAVSEVTPEQTNGYASFFVAPDGSKEGWGESHAGDGRRAQFKAWLRERSAAKDEANPLYVQWVEVFFGDDARLSEVVDRDDAEPDT